MAFPTEMSIALIEGLLPGSHVRWRIGQIYLSPKTRYLLRRRIGTIQIGNQGDATCRDRCKFGYYDDQEQG